MITPRDLAAAFAGVRGLVRLDGRAFSYFDASHAGFWKSFWAAAILAPFTIIIVVRGAMLAPPESLWRYAAFQTIGYVIGWLAFPLVMVRVLTILGRGERYYAYLVPHNWFQLAQIIFQGPLLLLAASGMMPPVVLGLASLFIIGALLGYEWYIARHTLEVERGTAAALVAIYFLLGLLIDRVSDALA